MSKLSSRVHIDPVRCKSCALCLRACPRKCLAISDNRNPAGYYAIELRSPEDCIGCGACVRTCPEPQCLTLEKASSPEPAQ